MLIITYILIPNLVALLFIFTNKQKPTSDHPVHVDLIKRIKRNNNRFVSDYMIAINEKQVDYPQLFHWLLSFFPEWVYKKKYTLVNITVKLIEIVAFNFFLFFVFINTNLETSVFLYANIVFNVFPFSYVGWNAKNLGLSARGISLVFGQIYIYLLVAYLYMENIYLLGAILIVILIIILLSQITLQFVLLSLPLVIIVFQIPELFPLPFLAFGLFYVLMPKIAKSYIIAQYNHKRNYALFMAKIFILKSRPSIYRDFVFDFWIKFKKDNALKALHYIYSNPLVEIIYGFPYLWFVIFCKNINEFPDDFVTLYYLVFISMSLFFITSFRWTRFLGEPQRYLEFVIPLITILFVVQYDLVYVVSIVLCSSLLIVLYRKFLNKYQKTKLNSIETEKDKLLVYMQKIKGGAIDICISNDNELLKFIVLSDYKICRPDYSTYFRTGKDFYSQFYDNDLVKLSPNVLATYFLNFRPDIIIINNSIYGIDKLTFSKELILLENIGSYSIYQSNLANSRSC